MKKSRLFSLLIKFLEVKKRSISKQRNFAKGEYYDLDQIYNELNDKYFGGRIQVRITWFASKERKAYRYRKLGLYCFDRKLIKIHRLLDQSKFPPYFISYVVYHEMLHHVCPPLKPKKGRRHIHHSDFKKREMEFAEYKQVKRWEQANKKLFF